MSDKKSDKRAKAPYNFVPLNESLVLVYNNKDELPSFDKYHQERFSGYIELDIETKTPIFIRGEGSQFFKINNKPFIPGSSLRGMVRTLLEIVSFGKFGFCDIDRKLFYRAVGDSSRLGDEYRSLFTNQQDCCSYKFCAGILKRENGIYKIYPSKKIKGTQIFRVEETTIKYSDLPEELKNSPPYSFFEIYFEPSPLEYHTHYREDKKKNKKVRYELKYAKVERISANKESENMERGYLIITGDVDDKKHMQWIISDAEGGSPIDIDKKIIESYESDNNRKEEYSILEKLEEKRQEQVPVFYLADEKGELISIGHTGFFRIPYKYTIGDYIPENLKSADGIDFAEALFGKEGEFASRVFFEDAELAEQNNKEDIFFSETVPQILSSPKPTCFQHYLEQDSFNNKKLKHWNDKEAKIRGYKLYWHRATPDDESKYSWKLKQFKINKSNYEKFLNNINKSNSTLLNKKHNCVEISDKDITIKCAFNELPKDIQEELKNYLLQSSKAQYTVIQPVKSGIKFKGRIRFENLSKEELGALLFVLDLPGGHYHKIGMGKPLGLGSIAIKPTLFIIDRSKRYKKLFEDDKWYIAAEKREDISEFKKAFEEYILCRISENERGEATSLWEIPRIKELKEMLNWRHTEKSDWLEKTRYMLINHPTLKNEFKDRPVLPKPTEVVDS
ncbi:TIGR03986 family type III CRISPR-associated RAMP protein [Anaerocellum danielii]|uniref:TIGR03986 family CRISPR-associated RAMP protein n=1 Tax=Anaerocellum danielii TaxID=1387557 RepID=A0ABZ0TZR5_9FIRM|nr:TIGR03986 family CRISPR-associated RAMP protein [Caldicellulosiruptor danielii]WPX08966.1 TIGR03986 family CRISPR-associated RAMP protein [Caldicellulosiruptor danielii]